MAHQPVPRHRKRLRLPGFDYRDEGPYFVTVCTWQRRWVLGAIHDGVLLPSPIGRIVQEEWFRLPSRFQGLVLDAFTLMPNHVHGILAYETNAFSNAPLSTVVGSWKSASTLRLGSLSGHSVEHLWQRGFHDSILRNHRSLDAVRAYIQENPGNWDSDSLRHMESP